MGFIPDWALGVGVIIIAITAARTLSGMLRMMSTRAAARNLTPSDEEISELRQSLDAVQNRLSEVEERLDFTERLLAKQRDAERLGSPPR
jgi:septal ring factor EnvC (AmiA/AmiB activator)